MERCHPETLRGVVERSPRSRRVIDDGHMHDTAALMRKDDQHEQEPARRSRHDEEVGGGDLLEVVSKERAPRL